MRQPSAFSAAIAASLQKLRGISMVRLLRFGCVSLHNPFATRLPESGQPRLLPLPQRFVPRLMLGKLPNRQSAYQTNGFHIPPTWGKMVICGCFPLHTHSIAKRIKDAQRNFKKGQSMTTIIPATSIRIPRLISQITKAATMPTIIALQTVAAYWAAWHAVYRGGNGRR